MKKLLLVLTLSLVFALSACAKSLEDYEEMLEEKGWEVETITIDEFMEEFSPDESLEGATNILFASKLESYGFGFIIEFDSRSNAKDYYESIVDDEEDAEDIFIHKGVLVFFALSEDFFTDLDLD